MMRHDGKISQHRDDHKARFMLADPPAREQRHYSLFSPRLGHGDAAGDPGAFRKVFARFVGLTPGEYRQRFGVTPHRS